MEGGTEDLRDYNYTFFRLCWVCQVSYIWYSGLGACTVILIGLVASLLVPRDVETLDRRLLSPCLHTIYQVTPYYSP